MLNMLNKLMLAIAQAQAWFMGFKVYSLTSSVQKCRRSRFKEQHIIQEEVEENELMDWSK